MAFGTIGTHPTRKDTNLVTDPIPTTPPSTVRPIRDLVRAAVARAWERAVASGALPTWPEGAEPPAVEVERPADAVHGDFASNLAMRLARPYRMAPTAIADALATELVAEATTDRASTPVASADVAAPGFLNMRLDDRALETTIAAILADPASWGRVAPIRPRSVNVEFVSANPTGPLHVGNARGAFIGDLLSRVLEAGGQRVTREYYFNDGGADPQPGRVGGGAPARRAAARGGLQGRLRGGPGERHPRRGMGRGDSARCRHGRAHRPLGRGPDPRGDRGEPRGLGVRFDVWTSEARLHDEGWVERAVERLRERGHVYEQDGATWFRSTDFGDDKDRVIFRSNGEPTYFAADIGYVTEKFSRGFDHLIYIWGADHHGTGRAGPERGRAMGYDREAVQMLLYAWVRFVRDGQEVSMSKRAGEFITLDELLAEVGVDAARWFFASRAATTGIDFDIELAKKQSNENPSTTSSTRTPGSRRSCAERRRDGPGAGDRRDRGLAGARRAALARAVARFRRWSRTRSLPRRPRASPPMRPSSRPRSTPSTATRGSWTRPSPERSARGSPSPRRPGSRWRTR